MNLLRERFSRAFPSFSLSWRMWFNSSKSRLSGLVRQLHLGCSTDLGTMFKKNGYFISMLHVIQTHCSSLCERLHKTRWFLWVNKRKDVKSVKICNWKIKGSVAGFMKKMISKYWLKPNNLRGKCRQNIFVLCYHLKGNYWPNEQLNKYFKTFFPIS